MELVYEAMNSSSVADIECRKSDFARGLQAAIDKLIIDESLDWAVHLGTFGGSSDALTLRCVDKATGCSVPGSPSHGDCRLGRRAFEADATVAPSEEALLQLAGVEEFCTSVKIAHKRIVGY
jgi:hypothetical protein